MAIPGAAGRHSACARLSQHEGDGTVRKYDDLPPQYRANLNIEPSFDRHVGDKPRLSGEEIDDIIAFCRR